tara:strand:- start:2600 stop:5062 length:2463 start_codon:yes stop_codon:yes gene_type:complete
MSDYFITNITGVPTTGQYGPDGKPLNVNNDGGIEITPQNAGNVPSAGTESREGIGNDKSITGNAYNPNASSTDAQSIGPAPATDQTHYAYTQSHSLYKQASIDGDKADWNLYTQDPVNVLSGYLSTYNGYYSIRNSMDLEEGQPTVYHTPMSPTNPPPQSFTVHQGGSTTTSVLTAGRPGSVQNNVGVRQNAGQVPACFSGTVDLPCEIDKTGCPQGKRMRVFAGDGCDGMNGYWMQITNPVNIGRPYGGPNNPIARPNDPGGPRVGDRPEYDPNFWLDDQGVIGNKSTSPWPNLEDHALIDCDTYTKNLNRRHRSRFVPPGWSQWCYGPGNPVGTLPESYCEVTNNNPSHYLGRPVFAHNLTYIGTSIADFKNRKWCEYCNQFNPESTHGSPSKKPCDEVVGWTKWFLEGPSCDTNKQDLPDFKGKLYGCCCKLKIEDDPNTPNHICGACNGCQKLFTLTEIPGLEITMGSSDDPCSCLYREEYGPLYWKENRPVWENLETLVTGNGNQRAFVTGCLESNAQNISDDKDNVYIMSTGSGAAPYFNSGECAWMYSLKSGVRCTGIDAQANPLNDNELYGYCPTGDDVLISDRNLHYGDWQFTSYTGCVGAECNPQCTIGDSLFEVGEYVNLTSYMVSGYGNLHGGFSGAFDIDFSASGTVMGGGHSSPGPFSTGCAYGSSSFCVWTFSATGEPGTAPGGYSYGNWGISDSGECCDCSATLPTRGLLPGGSYAWIDTEPFSIDCSGSMTGCDILTQGWEIIEKQSGNWDSTPDSLDCTWGYGIQFTGCPTTSGICAATGFAPWDVFQYIPESYFTSGTGCV